MEKWIGLDVGVDELIACAIDDAGHIIATGKMATCPDQVSRFINDNNLIGGRIGLEAGSTTAALTRHLRRQGHLVHVFDTRQASKFLKIRRNKTDANDARGLADIVRFGRGVVGEVHVKSAEMQQIRSRLALRQRLVRHRMAGESAINSTFRLNRGKLKRSFSARGLGENIVKELERIRLSEGIDLAPDIMPVLAICQALRRHLETSDRQLQKFVEEHPICGRFLQIPGVGFITALSVYSAIEDPDRFKRSADIGPYFGLVPRVAQSGDSLRRFTITKMGNSMTRGHLMTAAHILMGNKRAENDLRDWALAIAERADKKRARVALARKLAIVMLSLWKTGQDFRPRNSVDCKATAQSAMHGANATLE